MNDWLDRMFSSLFMQNFVKLMGLTALTCGAILLAIGLVDRL